MRKTEAMLFKFLNLLEMNKRSIRGLWFSKFIDKHVVNVLSLCLANGIFMWFVWAVVIFISVTQPPQPWEN